jgi:hypothetical protein
MNDHQCEHCDSIHSNCGEFDGVRVGRQWFCCEECRDDYEEKMAALRDQHAHGFWAGDGDN